MFDNIDDIILDYSPMTAEPPKSSNTVWHHATVTRERCELLNDHRGVVVLFAGLSGAGKINDFTNISLPCEAPERSSLILDPGSQSPDQCADHVVKQLRYRQISPRGQISKGRQQA